MRNLAGLLIIAFIAGLFYKFYFSKSMPEGGGTPRQAIDAVGAKNDLLGIAQAERAYQAEHGGYASLDELTTSGALSVKKNRDGYTYDIESSPASFRAFAHCAPSTNPGCTSYSIDQSMEIQTAP
jgi:hypothetical protein